MKRKEILDWYDREFNLISDSIKNNENLSHYDFLVKDREEIKEINETIEQTLGKAVLENHKIEVDEMIS